MGFLDSLVKKTQEKIDKQVESITKKLEAMPENIVNRIEIKKEQPKTKTPNKIIKNNTKKAVNSSEKISEQTLAQLDNIRKNGFEEFEFIANKGCCDICAKLRGKHFPISAFKIGVNAPPRHEGCRCSITSYEDEEAYKAWLNKF